MYSKPPLLSGDTPTGQLHLGHVVGSLDTRVKLQDSHDCYFIIANLHAFTTLPEQGKQIRQRTLDIVLDYLAAGIDPKKSTIFIQSEVPAIAELTYLLSMFVSSARVRRNPTLKEELHSKGLESHHSFGFLLYPVGQIADILAFKAERVPVGADQLPHLEMTKEVARRFNQIYCSVDPHTPDQDAVKAGGLFPIIQPEPFKAQRLVGLGPPNASGVLRKMSKSFDNAIYLRDPPDVIQKKVMNMYTDPTRIRVTDPGNVENNPLWILHDTFNTDKHWVATTKERYRAGQVGDVICKKRLVEVLVETTRPMRERLAQYKMDIPGILKILREGNQNANHVAETTLAQVKKAMHLTYSA